MTALPKDHRATQSCSTTIPGPTCPPLNTELTQPQGLCDLQSQRCQTACPSPNKDFQSGNIWSPILVFITQTNYPNPNLPIGKVNSINIKAFPFKIFHLFTFPFISFLSQRKSYSFFPKFNTPYLGLRSPSSAASKDFALLSCFFYPQSVFPAFLPPGLKNMAKKSFSPPSPPTKLLTLVVTFLTAFFSLSLITQPCKN